MTTNKEYTCVYFSEVFGMNFRLYLHLQLDGWLVFITYILACMPFGSPAWGWCIAREKHIFYGAFPRLLRHWFNEYLAFNVIQLWWIKSWFSCMVVLIIGQRPNTVVIVLWTSSNWKRCQICQTYGLFRNQYQYYRNYQLCCWCCSSSHISIFDATV